MECIKGNVMSAYHIISPHIILIACSYCLHIFHFHNLVVQFSLSISLSVADLLKLLDLEMHDKILHISAFCAYLSADFINSLMSFAMHFFLFFISSISSMTDFLFLDSVSSSACFFFFHLGRSDIFAWHYLQAADLLLLEL